MSTTETARRPRRVQKLLLLQLVLWPVLLLLAEGGVRGVLWARGVPYSADATTEEIRALVDRSSRFVPTLDHPVTDTLNELAVRVLHPFAGYSTVGAVQELERRVSEIAATRNEDAFEVLILGGSVAQMFGRFGRERFTNLVKRDARFADREIVFLNFGEGGYKQPQQASLLAYLFALGLEPDAVIHIDGYNEVALGARNTTFGTHPTYPSIPHWGSLVSSWANDRAALDLALELRSAQRSLESLGSWALENDVARSAILGSWVSGRLNGLTRRTSEATDALTRHLVEGPAAKTLAGPELPAADSSDDVIVRLWAESTRSMRALCDTRGIPYVHALQPTLHDLGSKPLAEEERARTEGHRPAWLEAVTRVYPRLRERGSGLVDEGLNFVDATRAFSHLEKLVYTDNCHYTGQGNRILANHLVEPFLAAVR